VSAQRGARFGTSSLGVRWGSCAVGLGAITLLGVGLAPGVASAAPRNPTDTQISRAEQERTAAAERVGAITAQLAEARAGADAAHQAALIVQQDYEDKHEAAGTAKAAADAAAAEAAQAELDVEKGRDDVSAFARDSYMRGSTTPGMSALLTAGGPAELIERAALLDAAGTHRSDVLVELTALEVEAGNAERAAAETAGAAAELEAQAAVLLADAQAQEASARAQADAVDAQEDALQAELQEAQQTVNGLQGARAAAQQEAARQAAARQTPATRSPGAAPAPAPAPTPAPAPAPAPRPQPAPGGGSAGAPSVSAAQTAIAAARTQLGVPYSWGGGGSNGPSRGIGSDSSIVGFDCSGLTQYAYARAGIAIGGTSRDQWWLNRNKKVAPGDLQPGDLLFWGGDRYDYMSITHVAIYIGGGQMIEAPYSGQDVTVARARTSSSTYFGAVRPSA
jgi:cell wall-associated NlpC family hydrolase